MLLRADLRAHEREDVDSQYSPVSFYWCWEIVGAFFDNRVWELPELWAVNSAVTDAFTSLFAALTPAWQMRQCNTLKLQWDKINSIPLKRFCFQRLLNIIIPCVALESWKDEVHHMPRGRKKMQQKMPMVNVALVGKLKEHHFGVQNCWENRYYSWTDHIVQHFRQQLYSASERKKEKPVCAWYSGKMFKINLSIWLKWLYLPEILPFMKYLCTLTCMGVYTHIST